MSDPKFILKNLRSQIATAEKENRAAEKSLSEAPTLASLSQDASYFKLAIYGLGVAIVVVGIGCWQLFLRMDDKLDRKMDYINSRIDGAILRELETKPSQSIYESDVNSAAVQPERDTAPSKSKAKIDTTPELNSGGSIAVNPKHVK